MDFVTRFLELAFVSVPVGLFVLSPLAAIGLVGLVAALFLAGQHPVNLQNRWGWLILPFAIPLVILLYGTIFYFDGAPGTAPDRHGFVLLGLVLLHGPLAFASLLALRSNPLVPLGMTVFQVWLSLSAGFVSSMAVSNLWL